MCTSYWTKLLKLHKQKCLFTHVTNVIMQHCTSVENLNFNFQNRQHDIKF